jgi:LysM repeat protein
MQLKKVPASITLAQGILESGNGNSNLAKFANNHFGIKCHTEWTGEKYYQDDDSPNECFRKYKSVLDSYKDHADFLTGRERYKSLFSLEITDYKGWAKGLKAAGYATNPTYADQLISLIERYELYKYDKEALSNQVVIVDANNNNNNNTSGNNNNNTSTTAPGSTGTIVHINSLRAVRVGKGQTKSSIATAFEISVKQLEKYNELGPGDELTEGQLIFTEPKRAVAESGVNFHTVKAGETFYTIAQQYGMKTDALMRKNNMWYGSVIQPGDKLYLRKKKPM